MRTTTQLRRLVSRPDIAFMMEAHDGLSARIVEEAGFEGIRLRQLQQHATPRPEADAGGCGRRGDRGQLFPKTTSFLRSELQPLADIAEFCGKIKAGKDSQQDGDFVLISREHTLQAGGAFGAQLADRLCGRVRVFGARLTLQRRD